MLPSGAAELALRARSPSDFWQRTTLISSLSNRHGTRNQAGLVKRNIVVSIADGLLPIL